MTVGSVQLTKKQQLNQSNRPFSRVLPSKPHFLPPAYQMDFPCELTRQTLVSLPTKPAADRKKPVGRLAQRLKG